MSGLQLAVPGQPTQSHLSPSLGTARSESLLGGSSPSLCSQHREPKAAASFPALTPQTCEDGWVERRPKMLCSFTVVSQPWHYRMIFQCTWKQEENNLRWILAFLCVWTCKLALPTHLACVDRHMANWCSCGSVCSVSLKFGAFQGRSLALGASDPSCPLHCPPLTRLVRNSRMGNTRRFLHPNKSRRLRKPAGNLHFADFESKMWVTDVLPQTEIGWTRKGISNAQTF